METKEVTTKIEKSSTSELLLPTNRAIHDAAKAFSKGFTWGVIEAIATAIVIIGVMDWIFSKLFGW